jgi:MarR family transcriptional regulator, 2-MHQ and catechol-resistance regulon repressor
MPYDGMMDQLQDDRLTLVGLFVESFKGLSGKLERGLDQETGLSLQWFELLIRLARSPGRRLRMSDLAMQTSLTPSGLTRAVDRLEEAGLVERAACPSDRRGAFAALTEAGLARITEAVGPHLRDVEEHLTGLLSADEQRDLARLLRKVRDHVNPEAAVVTPPPDDEPGDESGDEPGADEAVA